MNLDLYEAIKHGDEEHQAWLRDALTSFSRGEAIPPPPLKKMPQDKLLAPFPKERVQWRAGQMSRSGTSALALAYIDARDVMNRLDEVCGFGGWQCTYKNLGGIIVCAIGIHLTMPQGEQQWVFKEDGAGATDVEAEKGALSDAFKRAAVRWGIGRYLYDMPSPWVECESYESGGKQRFKRWLEDPWSHVDRHRPPPADVAKPGLTVVPQSVDWALWEKLITSEIERARSVDDLRATAKTHKQTLGTAKESYSAFYQAVMARMTAKKELLMKETAHDYQRQ